MEHDTLTFYVNGRKVIEKNADPEITLLTYLRNKLRLTGSKLGCGEGGCGACTVMVSKWDENAKKIRHWAVNACLAPVVSIHGYSVTTVEGIGSTRTKLHQVQERLARFHGSQCGFCTPGIVMSMYALLRNKNVPTSKDIENSLQGNLCRCTGYRPIISAFHTFTCGKGDACCRNRVICDKADGNHEGPYDPTQEPIFPPELLNANMKRPAKSLTFIGANVTWYEPLTLKEMLSLKSRHPDARIVVGNTEVGIEMYIKGKAYNHLICPKRVQELNEMSTNDNGVLIGAACTLTDVEDYISGICGKRSSSETQALNSLMEMFELFAGSQIRNVACIGGNIMTASPISDLNPIFMACEAVLMFRSFPLKYREVKMDDEFFTGYRKTNTRSDEVLVSLKIPFQTEDDVMRAYKQSKRKEDDIAIVNAAMRVKFQTGSSVVEKLAIAYGGMDAMTKMAKKTMQKAIGRRWNKQLLEDVCHWLSDEMQLGIDAPGGMVKYRQTLVTSFFYKFYHYTFAKLVDRKVIEENNVKFSRSIIKQLSAEEEPFQSTQSWEEVPDKQIPQDGVGRPFMHASGLKHATGEAQYIDDMPPYENELHMAPVYSSRPHAKILFVDTSIALTSDGAVDFVDIQDVTGDNLGFEDEDVFADGKVTCVGHIIGCMVADTHDNAVKAARLVRVEYEDILPKIITIEDAIEHQSFYGEPKVVKGDITKGFAISDHILQGEIRMGGQEHFYLETHSCIAVPRNGECEMEVISSTQDTNLVQGQVAKCLGIPSNHVVVKTKRMGGGFGGKQSKSVKTACPAAVAAQKLGRPVRFVLTRQDDMMITGSRHPFLAKYKIGFNNGGRVQALELKMYSNGGNTLDLSFALMAKALFQCDNAYNIPHADVTGYICRTNVASYTAFRGFGNPQGTFIAEDWIGRIADYLRVDPDKVREINMYKDGDTLVYGPPANGLTVRRCWNECIEKSGFYEGRERIRAFNAKSRWKKRGIACVPTKFSVAYEALHMNQAGALVLVYVDGTVLLSHGGAEMGQGLYTKMIQVASRALGVPADIIHTMETSTASIANASGTAASVGSDLNGMAVKDACEKLVARLEPLRKANPNLSWKELVNKAYVERISLAATGFYKTPGIENVWDHKAGKMEGDWANYRTSGAAVTEVEIDVLTGHHALVKTDIVMDVGNSLNPAVDIGQIEGAFTQGYGLLTIEEPLHSPDGRLLTVGPGAYKIPGFSNTPKRFNVHLLKGSSNEKAIYSSKAVGEPPLLLGCSAFCAIKDAIKSARRDAGIEGPFRLDSPATAERIRMACEDKFTSLVKESKETKGVLPWSIRT